MIKKTIIELIQERCKSIDQTAHFQGQYLESYCDQVWQEFIEGMHASEYVDTSFYTKEYTISSLDGGGTALYYSDLPETTINLPRTGSGVMSIRLPDQYSVYFKPVTEDDFIHIQTQEVYRQGDDLMYHVGYDKVYYSGAVTPTIASSGVVMRLVIPFSKYTLTEDLPLPLVKENAFIDAVVERVIGTPAPDLYNNNSDE